jgi:hypothetical protein
VRRAYPDFPPRPAQVYAEAFAEADHVIESLREPASPFPGTGWHGIPLLTRIVAALL